MKYSTLSYKQKIFRRRYREDRIEDDYDEEELPPRVRRRLREKKSGWGKKLAIAAGATAALASLTNLANKGAFGSTAQKYASGVMKGVGNAAAMSGLNSFGANIYSKGAAGSAQAQLKAKNSAGIIAKTHENKSAFDNLFKAEMEKFQGVNSDRAIVAARKNRQRYGNMIYEIKKSGTPTTPTTTQPQKPTVVPTSSPTTTQQDPQTGQSKVGGFFDSVKNTIKGGYNKVKNAFTIEGNGQGSISSMGGYGVPVEVHHQTQQDANAEIKRQQQEVMDRAAKISADKKAERAAERAAEDAVRAKAAAEAEKVAAEKRARRQEAGRKAYQTRKANAAKRVSAGTGPDDDDFTGAAV